MDRFAHYAWPFFEGRHAALARQAEAWASENLGHAHGEDADAICKRLVQDLGCAGYLKHCVNDTPMCAPSLSCARCSPTTPGSPTSPSSCRGWEADRLCFRAP